MQLEGDKDGSKMSFPGGDGWSVVYWSDKA